jgi:hypothetical protein
MVDVLLFVAGLALWLYGLIDCARTEQEGVKFLPKWAWLILVIVFGTLGALAWLLVGRPKRFVVPRPRATRVIPPDDNPDFLKNL